MGITFFAFATVSAGSLFGLLVSDADGEVIIALLGALIFVELGIGWHVQGHPKGH